VQIGLVLPSHGRWKEVAELASGAERLGVGSLWLSDPPDDSETGSGGFPLEPLTSLAGLARVTATARLGVLLRAGARPPTVVAKALSTIDVLSGGRVTVGLEERPDAGAAEVDALDEAVQIMRGAFGGGPFTFQGRHHRCEGLRCRPRPLQRPAPPIWVSGTDRRLMALAARHADGWGPSGCAYSLEEYRRLAGELGKACEEAGREPGELHRFVCRAVPADDAGRLGGEMAAWAQSGVATLLLDRRGVALPAANGAALEHELEIVESGVSSAR